LGNSDFENHRLAVRKSKMLLGGQRLKRRQVEPLHRGFGCGSKNGRKSALPAKRMKGGEFAPCPAFEFGEGELIMGKQQ